MYPRTIEISEVQQFEKYFLNTENKIGLGIGNFKPIYKITSNGKIISDNVLCFEIEQINFGEY